MQAQLQYGSGSDRIQLTSTLGPDLMSDAGECGRYRSRTVASMPIGKLKANAVQKPKSIS
jgi:hypothetical protein